MTDKKFSAVNFFRILGALMLVLNGGSAADASPDGLCALERETECRLEKGLHPQFARQRYAQMHGGCGAEDGHMGPGCMRGGGHGHRGRHGRHGMHGMHGGGPDGDASGGTCPQERNTVLAPEPWQNMRNPLSGTPGQVEQGRLLFQVEAQPNCTACHGAQGDGAGPMGMGLVPPPRNFTCAETMNPISDGQLFWIIRNGSEGTAMPAFGHLPDESVWQIILYLRELGQGTPSTREETNR